MFVTYILHKNTTCLHFQLVNCYVMLTAKCPYLHRHRGNMYFILCIVVNFVRNGYIFYTRTNYYFP